MRQIALIIHNVRSAHNVGSMLRTAEGLGVELVFMTGYTPYPSAPADQRLPHLASSVSRKIDKTALGAQKHLKWQPQPDLSKLLDRLKSQGYEIAALEQTPKAIELNKFKPSAKLVLIVGNEVGGLPAAVLKLADAQVQIPMSGKKESFNVAVAAAIAMYHFKKLA